MSEHTPGPWVYRGPVGAGHWIGSDTKDIAIAYGSSTNPDGPANTSLITAAPDMFEAIEQALDDMGETGHSVCEQAKQMLRAAMSKAKAEGRTP